MRTLDRVVNCDPAPAEILVHVDGAEAATMDAVAKDFPQVKLLSSPARLGPGGARNVLIRAASLDWVANFDDDSYPDHADFFGRVMNDIRDRPDAAVFSAGHLPMNERSKPMQRVAVFSGCGCVCSRPWFLRTTGYVPRVVAYGFEEVDVSLQLHALGGVILLDPGLNVLHDHPLTGRFPTDMVAATIANAFLFPWVRYPASLLPLGFLQGMRYAATIAADGRGAVVRQALAGLPRELTRYRSFRRPVAAAAVLSWLRLRRASQPETAAAQ